MKYTVTFIPDQITTEVEAGKSLLHAANSAGIGIKSSCGSEGTCGRCKVKVIQGKYLYNEKFSSILPQKHRKAGFILACKAYVEDNLTVEIPLESRLDEHQVLLEDKQGILAEKNIPILNGYTLDPLCKKIQLTMDAPNLTEIISDASRLEAELSKQADIKKPVIGLPLLSQLAETLRKGDWQVTVTIAYNGRDYEIVRVEPGHDIKPCYGIAVDIGTTTVVASLVDMERGLSIDKLGTYNRQAKLGDDVVSRMIHCSSEQNGLEELQHLVIQTINDLISKLLARNNLSHNDIGIMVTSSNTTMTHLFLGLHPKYIRLEPYVPTATFTPVVKGKELGLNIHPEGLVYSFPAVASYVGGDIVSGVLFTNISKKEELTLFIDIGTNGEIVLGNQDWLISCACSAGPAFEGGGITYGTRAMKGAIERVEIDKDTFEVKVSTIDSAKATGICGSGLIDCIAKMHQVGIIDRTGAFQDTESRRVQITHDDKLFILVWKEESGIGKDIYISENDIKNLIRSKGAVFAGIQSLLKTLQLEIELIDKILIAGGFGNYLNISDAIRIGLLPDLPIEKYEFVGNTSLKGAELALISKEAWNHAEIIGKMMTYLELSVGNLFMDEFMQAIFLPHTDLKLFPSVELHANL
ncbi:MAG: DUF4445 domain-containing protein [Clostridia bacterium]|nr:DUF4445 domain-containing protein [Clostridia bacterium]